MMLNVLRLMQRKAFDAVWSWAIYDVIVVAIKKRAFDLVYIIASVTLCPVICNADSCWHFRKWKPLHLVDMSNDFREKCICLFLHKQIIVLVRNHNTMLIN